MKMGKTEKGAIWIDKDKISAYDFYQGIYQTPDSCVEMMFAIFTDINMNEVRELISKDIVTAKKKLAYEITKFVRGEEDAIEAESMSNNLFNSKQINLDNTPILKVNASDFSNSISTVDLLTLAKFVQSKSEARRLIEQKGLSKNNVIIENIYDTISLDELKSGILFKKGKKNLIQIIAE